MRNILTVSIIPIILLGCAAVGVPHTSDPMGKLSYAYSLMNQERPIPAERLGNEAMEIFSREGNEVGIAEVYIFFGQFYKHPSYRKFEEFYTKRGEYDSTNSKSIIHTQKAADIYLGLGNYTQLAKAQFALANAYNPENNEKACGLYNESINSYEKGKVENPNESFQFNPGFSSFDAMVRAFINKYCDSGA